MSNSVSNLDTTLSITIGDDDDSNDSLVVLEASNKPPTTKGTGFFLLHTKLNVNLINTSGFIFLVSNLNKHYEELIGFTGERVKAFKYPDISNISIQPVGQIKDKNGLPVTVNRVKNSLIASKYCYGYVKVSYEAHCQLWQANFEGDCSELNPDENINLDDVFLEDSYTPILISAIKNGEYLASLELNGNCENNGQPSDGNANFNSGEKLPNIQLEIDPDDPPQLGSGGYAAACSVRVYPGSLTPEFLVTSGRIIENSESAIQLQVRETIIFQGSSIVSTRYTPSSRVNAIIIGAFPRQFINKFGIYFSPNIILPGETIVIVEWIAAGHYRNPQPRKLNVNEIGVGNLFGNAIESFGIIDVTYNVTYKKTKFVFDYDSSIRRYKESFLVVKEGKQTGNLKLNPPKMKGIK